MEFAILKNVNHLILINVQNKFLMIPVLLKEYSLFRPDNERYIDQ